MITDIGRPMMPLYTLHFPKDVKVAVLNAICKVTTKYLTFLK